ncbi:autophagy-related protein 9-like [Chenopodium quinoa]|uniref:autophagy-related protein 9-like n=1 Tax=Chenopodium quinoa TaxID=63459 RepID=UPI000B76E302|nr:autophagy-related protein 9-like [Chenopodium quinoa]
MSNWQGGRNALSIFKWKKPGDPSLSIGLLNDIPPEIELSEYGRVPSPGSESPSGLLNGESLKVEPIADLDLFFERLYSYYCEKGLWCIIVKWIVELLSLAFTICFSGFFLLFVDWNGLRNAKCGIDAVESGTKPCDLAIEALHAHPLTPLTLPKAIILGYLGIFSIYWVFCFLRFFAQLKETLRIRHFYYNCLHVTDDELKTMPWPSILEKVVRVQNSQKLCVVKDLSAHEIVMRLMRKENYLIGMINKGILAFPISKWIPGAGPVVKSGPNRGHQRLILTKTLEWTLNWSILQSMFDRKFCIREEFVSNPGALRKRLVVVGLAMLLLSPFLVIFMLVYLFLRHAEQFYNHPTTASSRRWSNLSKWMFREFNEVEHFFRHRINSSVIHASDYLKQFPSPIISVVAKFISFISGGFAAVLIIIALLDESLLEGHIFGRNLFWYVAVFGAITHISRDAVTDELLVLDPEGTMSLVVQHTHHMPKRWRGKENTETVRMEFETLFQYTAMTWLEEMASIFLTPYLLIYVVPKKVDDILQFISEFTVYIDGVGDVCSFSAFDFQKHGNGNYASPYNSLPTQRSSQGKMEKSFLSFQTSYPYWQSDAQGMHFLTTLRAFRNEKLRRPNPGYGHSPPRRWQQSPSLIDHNSRNSHFRRESPYNSPAPGYHLGSLWLIETDPKTHPYLLDWFYVSGARHVIGTNDVPSVSMDIDNEQSKEIWKPSLNIEASHGESWPNFFENRSKSHLEASTSSPVFLEDQSVLRHHDSSNMLPSARSHWWDRGGPSSAEPQQASFLEPPEFQHHGGPEQGSFLEPPLFRYNGGPQQASFLEPPEFNRHNGSDYYGSHSERSVDEHDQPLDWGNYHQLSRTTDPVEFGTSGGDFKLHFDDVYKPSEPPTINIDSRDLAPDTYQVN